MQASRKISEQLQKEISKEDGSDEVRFNEFQMLNRLVEITFS